MMSYAQHCRQHGGCAETQEGRGNKFTNVDQGQHQSESSGKIMSVSLSSHSADMPKLPIHPRYYARAVDTIPPMRRLQSMG